MSFFSELKRRNVFKVGIAYAVACWLLLQIVDLVLDNINAPDWVMQVFMLALAVGFPIAIIVAWAFEITPEGVRLEKDVDPNQSIRKETGRQLNRGIIMILIVAIVLLLTERFRDELFSRPDEAGPAMQNRTEERDDSTRSIAVLPFRDMSSAQDQGYFGEGIAEELLNALVKVNGLRVASRTSTFSLADENLDIPAIAERLGVNHVLEGSIRTSGQKVRVTAQLIEVSNDVHLWSETYDGSLDDIFKIQDEITAKIILAMEIQLGDVSPVTTSAGLTDNAEAYQLYLKGRHFWRQRSSDSLQLSIALFKQAIELDAGFHKAWSNLALAYENLPWYDNSFDDAEYHQLALQAAEQALALEPRSSEALSIIATDFERQCKRDDAAEYYQKAIQANPTDPTPHHWYAMLLTGAGRMSQALEQITLARQIDPLISAVISVEAGIYFGLGDYKKADGLYRQAAELGIYEGSAYFSGLVKAMQGDIEVARRLMAPGLSNVDEIQLSAIDLFLAAREDPGKLADFELFVSNLDHLSSTNTALIVQMIASLGSPYYFELEKKGMLNCAEKGYYIWNKPFQKLRGTPEFFRLMETNGTVDFWREYGWPDDCASLDQTLAECD